MNWFGSLLRALRSSVGGPEGDARALAALSATETRLYNESEVVTLAGGGEPSAELKSEIVRKYWAFVEQADATAETRAVFCQEFGRLFEGAGIVESLVQEAEQAGPPPLEPT